jgi:glycosidase
MRKKNSVLPWVKETNIYEVNIRQYTPEGTFQAFGKHLPRLRKMGVEVLWLMPITPISLKIRQGSLGSYYACSSYTTINEEFGTLADFIQLVNEAHQLGFKLIIDWVANHTGWDHHWTIEHPDWYEQDEKGAFTEKNGWHDVIDLNYAKPAMRLAMMDAMAYWIKVANIDGFRCDMAHLVPLDFWLDARIHCDAIKPLYWLAECEVVDYHQAFDTTYAWWWMHETEDFAKGESSLQSVRNVLHAYSQYPAGASKLMFTSNHDENSWNGTEYEKYGNAAKAWAVFTFTWQGIPLIYSGQENPNNHRLAFFDKDSIDWNDRPLLSGFYETLLSLRKSNPSLTSGETFILPSDNDDKLMAFIRKRNEQTVLVLLNVSSESRLLISVSHPWLTGNFRNVFSGISYYFSGSVSFEIQEGEFFVYEKINQP